MEREDQADAVREEESDGRQYGDWLARTLGPDWVEVEPGIYQPPEDAQPEPELEPEPLAESLEEVLRPAPREMEPAAPARREPSRRGWFRRG